MPLSLLLLGGGAAAAALSHALPAAPQTAASGLDCPSRAAALCGGGGDLTSAESFEKWATYGHCVDRELGGGQCGWVVAEQVMLAADKHPCKDGLRKYCGKELDKLDKAVKDTQIMGTIEAALDVVSCVAHNVDDIWKVCKPFEGGDDDAVCREQFAQACPRAPGEFTQEDATMFLSEYVSRVRCAATTQVLGNGACNRKALTYVLEDADAFFGKDDKKPCKDKLHKTCGNEIDALEKALKDTSIISSLQASVHLANCVIKNLDEIAKACHLATEDEDEDEEALAREDVQLLANKPTKKPTKPTKKPTPKPSNKPPTKKPTAKPSKKPARMVVTEFVNMALGHDSEACTDLALETCATEVALSSVLAGTVEPGQSNDVAFMDAEDQEALDSAGNFMLQMCLRANMDRVLRQCEGSSVSINDMAPLPMPAFVGTILLNDNGESVTVFDEDVTQQRHGPHHHHHHPHHPPCRHVWDNYADAETQKLPPCPEPHHPHPPHHHHHEGPPCRNPWDPAFLNLPPCPEHHHCSHHHRHHPPGAMVALGLLVLLSGGALVAHRRRRLAAAGDKKKCCRHRRRRCCGGKSGCCEEDVAAAPVVATVLDVEAAAEEAKEGYLPLVEPQAQAAQAEEKA